MKCPECDVQSEDAEYLRRHAVRKHKLSAENLYLALYCDNKRPLCQCGCGEELTTFHGIVLGYAKFKPGHQARVQNNWGHNEAVKQKSIDTRRQMFKNGELTTWNTGLTKEMDERVEKQAKACSQVILTDPARRQIRSARMTANRLSGIVPTLTGSAHPQWNGGSSAIQALARSHLHRVWTYPKLRAGNFHCNRCGSGKDLCVHHDQERFATILRKAMDTLGDVDGTFERNQSIAEWVAEYHVKNNVSGVVLCEDCHARAHAVE